MGSLAGSRTYLIGPMDRVPDGGVQWRARLTPWLSEKGVNVINPASKPVNIGIEDVKAREHMEELKSAGQYGEIRKRYKLMRSTDLRFCDLSDFGIIKIDMDGHACGTYEELFWINRMKHPCLCWCPQGKEKFPSWLFLALPHEHMFGSLKDLKEYLDLVDNMPKEEVNMMDRWLLLDFYK